MTAVQTEPTIDDLHARLSSIAPEIRNQDPSALAELVEIEAAIEAEEKRQRIADLADAEEADRERAKAEAEAEAQREVWRAEMAEAETRRDTAFRKFERLFGEVLEAAKDGIDAAAETAALGKRLDAPRSPDYRMLVENRIMRRVHDALGVYGIKPGIVVANEGRTPLADAKPARQKAK